MDVHHVYPLATYDDIFFLKIANSNHTIQFCIVTENTNSKEAPYTYG